MPNKGVSRTRHKLAWLFLLLAAGVLPSVASAVPKVIVISLDGATPRLVDEQMQNGILSPTRGLGLLQSKGIRAIQNATISPSLTAPGHIAIATGSTAANNDVLSNTFHLVASPFTFNISGFAAPIGGYLDRRPRREPHGDGGAAVARAPGRGQVRRRRHFPGRGRDRRDGARPSAPSSSRPPSARSPTRFRSGRSRESARRGSASSRPTSARPPRRR